MKPRSTSSPGNRFGSHSRLLEKTDFGRVFERATRSRDPLFTVLCRPNCIAHARLGLAVSRKHCRQAVGRNRIKRLVRESFRRQQDRLSGLDIVVINRPDATLASNARIFASLERHWQRCRDAHTRGPDANG